MNNALQNQFESLRQIVFVTMKRRWMVLLVVAMASAASAIGLSLYKDRYEASARIYVDTQTVLKPMMASLTFLPDMEQQVGMLARTLISRPNVERLVAQPDLRLTSSSSAGREALISKLMQQIKITPTASGNLYDISYRGNSPENARRLVGATLDLFVASASGDKRRDARDAGRFIEEQIRTHEVKLVEAEEHLKAFRIRNFGVSGVSERDYFTRVSATAEQVDKLRAELLAAERSRDSFRRELANEDPLLPTESPKQTLEKTPRSDAERRLDAQRRVHDDLTARFTEVHPDVIGSRRALDRLEREAQAERLAQATPILPADSGGKAATSPVYQKLRISLAEAEAAVASLSSQLETKDAQLAQVRALANRAPQVEAEHAQLNRDYDIIRKNYDSLVARRESAALGARLDESSHLTEFRVVEPPRVSPVPVFPSHLHLALMAVVLSLALGVLAAHVADLMSPTFDDALQLQNLSARPLLGAVAMVLTPPMIRRDRRQRMVFASAFSFIFCVQVAWVGWIALTPAQW